MPDKFDPYREALVMETHTIWPEEYDDWEPAEKARIEAYVQQHPEEAANLTYLRMHTGFCRTIEITPEDIERAEQVA